MLAVIVVVSVMAGSVNIPVYASESEKTTVKDTMLGDELKKVDKEGKTVPEVVKELKKERTVDSTTYLLNNGMKKTVYYSDNVRYEDEKGNIKEYNPALVKADEKYLSDSKRQYPVTIDPSVTWSGVTNLPDVYVLKSSGGARTDVTAKRPTLTVTYYDGPTTASKVSAVCSSDSSRNHLKSGEDLKVSWEGINSKALDYVQYRVVNYDEAANASTDNYISYSDSTKIGTTSSGTKTITSSSDWAEVLL